MAPARAVSRAGGAPSIPRAVLHLSFLAGPMLSMIDSSVVNVAVPAIVRGLHTSLDTASWAVSGYLLGLAIGLALTPWLARRFGTLPAYGGVLAGFVAASVVCALVPSAGLLIAARAVQGLLGAPMVPLTLGLLLGESGAARKMPASAGIMLFAAPALGPALGGVLISAFGWRSVFLINLPIGLIALAGVREMRKTSGHGEADPRARLDVPGLTLLAAGLGLATYGASQGPANGWLSAAAAPAWAGGLALVAGYVLRERLARGRPRPAPAVNLSLLRSPQRSLTLALTCVASVVLFAVLFLAPVFLQEVQHRSSTVTGLLLLPQGIVMGLASWLGNVILERGKTRPALITGSIATGLALLAASTLALALLTAQTPVWVTTTLLCGRGVALGLTVQPLVMSLLGNLDAAQLPDANTLFSITERLSGSFGIALLATVYATRARLTGSPVTAFHDCALLLAAVSAFGAIAACTRGLTRAHGTALCGPGRASAHTPAHDHDHPGFSVTVTESSA